eukprot:TRINITY_DN1965_c0_g1_i2.p1 TRINITY_DN1965_c0_g1~~TRINITY_DN1965_c0_g1_i2.p1  ORF type:complete len:235 (-),score=14.24 TRINITY_DN1965_c0_g1_i2:74-778(-)
MPGQRLRPFQRRGLSRFRCGEYSSQSCGSQSRVSKIETEQQWEAVMRKSQEQIVLVCFSSDFFSVRQKHYFLADLSSDRIFRNVLFVELIADDFKEVREDARIDRIPTYAFYYKGSFLEKVVDGDVRQVYDRLRTLVEQFMGIKKANGHPTWMKWLLGLAVTGGAIAAGTTKLMGKQRKQVPISSYLVHGCSQEDAVTTVGLQSGVNHTIRLFQFWGRIKQDASKGPPIQVLWS